MISLSSTFINAWFINKQIDWAARKQVMISTSIIEAKLFAMLQIDKKFIW